MVNKVTLIGNLGRDPEIRHFEGGNKVTRFSVATNENYQDRQGQWQTRTEWHDVVVWGNQAERAERQLQKGSLVYVEGKLTHRKWQDKEGNDRYNTEVVSNYFRSLERRESGVGSDLSDGGMNSSVDDQFRTAPQPASTPPMTAQSPEDDDLPF